MTKGKTTNSIQSDSLIVIPNIKKVSEFVQFAQWLSTPSEYREKKTQKEFAESIGLCQDTLTDWKQHPKLWFLVSNFTSTWIKERIPDVINGLYCNASLKGKANDVEAFLRLAGIKINKKS